MMVNNTQRINSSRRDRQANEAHRLSQVTAVARIIGMFEANQTLETKAALRIQAFIRGTFARKHMELWVVKEMKAALAERVDGLASSMKVLHMSLGFAVKRAATTIQKNFRCKKTMSWYQVVVIQHRAFRKQRKEAAILTVQRTARRLLARASVKALKDECARQLALLVIKQKIAIRKVIRAIRNLIKLKKSERDRNIRLQRRKGWRLRNIMQNLESPSKKSSGVLRKQPSDLRPSTSGTQQQVTFSSSKEMSQGEGHGYNIVHDTMTSDEIHESEVESEGEKVQMIFKPFARDIAKNYARPTEAQTSRIRSASPLRPVRVVQSGDYSSVLNNLFGLQFKDNPSKRCNSTSTEDWRKTERDDGYMRDTYSSCLRSGSIEPPKLSFLKKPKSCSMTLHYMNSTAISRIYSAEEKPKARNSDNKWANFTPKTLNYTPGLDNSSYQPSEWSPTPFNSRFYAVSRPYTSESVVRRDLVRVRYRKRQSVPVEKKVVRQRLVELQGLIT
jgi:hypothetical protein